MHLVKVFSIICLNLIMPLPSAWAQSVSPDTHDLAGFTHPCCILLTTGQDSQMSLVKTVREKITSPHFSAQPVIPLYIKQLQGTRS